MSNPMSYKEAIDRIREISQMIDGNDNDLDKLLAQVREAKKLLQFCEEKLSQAEMEIVDIFNDEEE